MHLHKILKIAKQSIVTKSGSIIAYRDEKGTEWKKEIDYTGAWEYFWG